MTIMRLKHYHEEQEQKRINALEVWGSKPDSYGYPVPGMFFFMLPDNVTRRKRGWVVKTKYGAKFFLNIEDAGEEQKRIYEKDGIECY